MTGMPINVFPSWITIIIFFEALVTFEVLEVFYSSGIHNASIATIVTIASVATIATLTTHSS